jgi:GT2 family glycosyltransferase
LQPERGAAASRPAVSLVLPNRNNEPVLDLFLTALERNTTYDGPLELIVVDDGSTDRSVKLLERWRDSGRLRGFQLFAQPASGIIDALNRACEAASGEVIVRLDGDATIETPGWLERMLALRAASERVGVVVGKVVFDSGRVHSYGMNIVSPAGVHSRGSRPTEPVGRRTLDIAVDYPPASEAEGGGDVAEVDGGIGCCMLFDRALWGEVGGFDSRFNPAGFEDFDFALGARAHGRKVFFLPDVEVVHRISLRNPREATSRRVMALYRLRRSIGRFVPAGVRDAAASRAGLGDYDPKRVALLRRHYEAWREKWGFDALNPDMDALLARWGGTEVCWRYDDEMRRAGEEIAARYRQTAGSS